MNSAHDPWTRRVRRLGAPMVTFVVVAAVLLVSTPTAHAAVATVPNGLTTTDLNAVGMSPSSLAAALVGPGVSVSNVTFSGSNAQAGLLHVVDPAVVSFNDGVIFSSGNIADVLGPNKSESTTGDMAGPGDADLTALIADTQTVNPNTYDATVLEFDFVPAASPVYFTYTFGSDEYLEWVNLFNDVFAFYVSGQNCATTPGGEAVSIDTINSTVNPNLYRDNSFVSPPANPINIEPDGLSVELICAASVNAGQTNHMKLAIADTSDQILDSVVMLKAHSLSTTQPESCNNSIDDNGDDLIDDLDPICQTTTTPPPPGAGGIGEGGSSPPFTGNEGTPIILDAASQGWTATPDTISTTWEVTGINGTPGSCVIDPAGPQPLNGDGTIAVVTAVCPNEGEYVAHVWGWDSEGSSSFDYDVDFFVHNAPPAVTITEPLSGAQVPSGSSVSVSATVTDPGVNDTLGCQINWGDGSADPGSLAGETCTGAHTYTGPDSYVVTVTATDDAGDSSAGKVVITVVTPDTTPPTFNPTFAPSPPPFLVGATGITVSSGAEDPSGIALESCGAVSTATAGLHSLTCTATDTVGNTGSVDVDYIVGYQLTNVTPAPGATFKRTAAIPVSFQLRDANGLVSDATAATLRPGITVSFDTGNPVAASYSKRTDTFSARLRTSKPASGSHTVTVQVVVGSTVVASIEVPVTIV